MKNVDIIHIFQGEFNRLLTPMEKEIIDDWKKEYQEPIIIECLKQAVFNGATSFRYINKILVSHKNEEKEHENISQQDLSWLD